MLRRLKAGRFVDLLAVLVIAFVAYKIFFAPRQLPMSAAHPAPHVTYAALSGGAPFVLQQQRGHLVFLDFYASWCEPCRISLPWVESFARVHPEVDVVPVDVGEPPGVARDFAQRLHLHGVVLDTQALSSGFFQIQGFPTMVVVDPQGRVRATWEGLNPAIKLNMDNAEKMLASR